MAQKHMFRRVFHLFFVLPLFFPRANRIWPLLAGDTGGPKIEVPGGPDGPETLALTCVSPAPLSELVHGLRVELPNNSKKCLSMYLRFSLNKPGFSGLFVE
jgi:hypothetical protein